MNHIRNWADWRIPAMAVAFGVCVLPSVVNAAPETSSLGCLHQDVRTCIEAARRFMTLRGDPEKQLRERSQNVDVNGRRIGGNRILLDGTRSPDNQLVTLDLTLTPSDTVSDIIATTSSNVATARTVAEYDKTGIYEEIAFLFGDVCAGDRMQLYKFFENNIKPRLSKLKRNVAIGDTNASTTYSQSAKGISFCGSKLSFFKQQGYDTNGISLENTNGVFSIEHIEAGLVEGK
jgi:hypothetical protein